MTGPATPPRVDTDLTATPATDDHTIRDETAPPAPMSQERDLYGHFDSSQATGHSTTGSPPARQRPNAAPRPPADGT